MTTKTASLQANQREAYAGAMSTGVVGETFARVLVADLTGESLANPKDVHPDPSRANPGQMAHGIASWEGSRAAAIAKQFGAAPQNLPVATQVRAAIWEMQSSKRFARCAALFHSDNEVEIMTALVENYECPANSGREIGLRMKHLAALPKNLAGGGVLAPVTAKLPTALKPITASPWSTLFGLAMFIYGALSKANMVPFGIVPCADAEAVMGFGAAFIGFVGGNGAPAAPTIKPLPLPLPEPEPAPEPLEGKNEMLNAEETAFFWKAVPALIDMAKKLIADLGAAKTEMATLRTELDTVKGQVGAPLPPTAAPDVMAQAEAALKELLAPAAPPAQ